MTTHDFEIVKAKGGFYIFEGLDGEWITCLKSRKEADRWIAQTIATRAEIIAHAEAVAAIRAEAKAELAVIIEAARAAAPKQLEMF